MPWMSTGWERAAQNYSRLYVDRPIVFFLVWLLVWFYKRWTAVGQQPGVTPMSRCAPLFAWFYYGQTLMWPMRLSCVKLCAYRKLTEPETFLDDVSNHFRKLFWLFVWLSVRHDDFPLICHWCILMLMHIDVLQISHCYSCQAYPMTRSSSRLPLPFLPSLSNEFMAASLSVTLRFTSIWSEGHPWQFQFCQKFWGGYMILVLSKTTWYWKTGVDRFLHTRRLESLIWRLGWPPTWTGQKRS